MALETLAGAQWNSTTKRCGAFFQRMSYDCENLTELGLLQLPLPHQGASTQHQVDGSKDQSSLPKRVKCLINNSVLNSNLFQTKNHYFKKNGLKLFSNIDKGTTGKSNANFE